MIRFNLKLKKFDFIRRHAFLFLLLIHICGIFFYYDALSLFNRNPIYNWDYPFHLYDCHMASAYIQGGSLIGYNPFMLGGYIHGISLSNGIFQLFCSFFGLGGQIFLMKSCVLIILAMIPVLIYASVSNFGFGRASAFTAFLLAMLYLYNDYFFNNLVEFGLFGFISASVLCIYMLSLFYAYAATGRMVFILVFFILFPALLLSHSMALLIFFPPFILLYGLFFKKLTRIANVLIISSLLAILVFFLFAYVYPFFSQIYVYNNDIVPLTYTLQVTDAKAVFMDFFYSSWYPSRGIQLVKTSLIVAGFFAIFRLRTFSKRLFIFFLSGSIFFLIIAYGHNLIPGLGIFSNIEPYRLVLPLAFLVIAPASWLISIFFGKSFKCRRRKQLLIAAIILFLAAVSAVHLISPPNHSLNTRPSDDYIELRQWIIDNTDKSARIIIESNLSGDYMFATPSLANSLLSLETGREIIAGRHRRPSVKQCFACITENIFLFRPHSSVDPSELRYYLEMYNVGWIIARSDTTKSWLLGLKESNPEIFDDVYMLYLMNYSKGTEYKYYIFKTGIEHSFFINGTGGIKIEQNRISIYNLTKFSDSIILKYHYHPTLRADKGLRLEPYYFGAPVPFIMISNIKAGNFEIYND